MNIVSSNEVSRGGKSKISFKWILIFLCLLTSGVMTNAETQTAKNEKPVKKILMIGDSMTGWLAERLNSYGKENGFEVATVVWDGSTIKKWGSTKRFSSIIHEQNPDAVFVSLGMNELFEANPEARLKGSLSNILDAIGNRPVVWVGPPSWPGHSQGEIFNNWLEKELGSDSYFRSDKLKLPRQSATNPHPTREGMVKWMDAVMEWIPEHAALTLPGVKKPTETQMSRGKYFIYKRMKEQL